MFLKNANKILILNCIYMTLEDIYTELMSQLITSWFIHLFLLLVYFEKN